MEFPVSIVFIGHIVTLNDAYPVAEAVCVTGGRISCVGTREAVLHYASAGTYELVELPHGVLYPGFIDSHSHISGFSEMINQVFCGNALGSIDAVLEALWQKATQTPTGEWVVGYGFDDTGISDKRHVTIEELDRISPDKPLLLKHISLHFAYVNTLAMQQMGYTAQTTIPNGEIVCDSQGGSPRDF